MNTSHSLIVISTVAAMALPGLALADRSYPALLDDPAVTAPPMTDSTARAEVLAALQQFRADPITDDGPSRIAGREIGPVDHRKTGNGTTPRARVLRKLWDFNDHPATDYTPYRFAGGEFGSTSVRRGS